MVFQFMMNMKNIEYSANEIKEIIDNAIVDFMAKNTMPAENAVIHITSRSQAVCKNIEENGYFVQFSKLHNYVFSPNEYLFITYPWDLVSYVDSPKDALVQCEIMNSLSKLVSDIFQVDNNDWKIAKYDWKLYKTFMGQIASQLSDHKLPHWLSDTIYTDSSLDTIIDSINEINIAIQHNQLDDTIELCDEYIDPSEVAETGYIESCGDGYDVFGDGSDITLTLQYFFAAYVAELTGATLVKYSDLIK